jgi:hypothetical protein
MKMSEHSTPLSRPGILVKIYQYHSIPYVSTSSAKSFQLVPISANLRSERDSNVHMRSYELGCFLIREHCFDKQSRFQETNKISKPYCPSRGNQFSSVLGLLTSIAK